jgi:hypothetical protein
MAITPLIQPSRKRIGQRVLIDEFKQIAKPLNVREVNVSRNVYEPVSVDLFGQFGENRRDIAPGSRTTGTIPCRYFSCSSDSSP